MSSLLCAAFCLKWINEVLSLNTIWKLTEGVGELLNFCKVNCGPLLQWVPLCPITEIQRDFEEFLGYIHTGIWCSYEFIISLTFKAHPVNSRRGENGEGWIYLFLEIETWVRGGWGFVAHGVFSDLLCKVCPSWQIIKSIKKCIMTNFRNDSRRKRVCWWLLQLRNITVAITTIFAISIPSALLWSALNSHYAFKSYTSIHNGCTQWSLRVFSA